MNYSDDSKGQLEEIRKEMASIGLTVDVTVEVEGDGESVIATAYLDDSGALGPNHDCRELFMAAEMEYTDDDYEESREIAIDSVLVNARVEVEAMVDQIKHMAVATCQEVEADRDAGFWSAPL